jgi:sulfate/thiosulfate transport system substrate-binding protein
MNKLRFRSVNKFLALLFVGISLTIGIAACTGDSSSTTSGASSAPKPVELTLVSFAVTQAAYEKIVTLFTEKWKQEHNHSRFAHFQGGSSD